LKNVKNPLLFILGVGISNLGNWIYLVAITLLVLQLTDSAAAVAGLFLIRPLASLFTNTWSGSVIDRFNKRTIMIVTDCVRGLLIATIPFLSSIWLIYACMFVVNIAGSFFGPTSSVYVAKLIPVEQRTRFNSVFVFMTSGAFLVGPSLAGVIIAMYDIDACIYLNAISFFVCAIAIYFLPDVDDKEKAAPTTQPSFYRTMLGDWHAVAQFTKTAKYFMLIYLLFQSALLLGFAADSQEATYIKRVLLLTEQDYGLLVSITGGGYLAGSAAAAWLANRLSLRIYIGIGMALTGLGYVAFYASSTFIVAAAGFIALGFFSAFANAGFTTFFQNHVPIELMGRFSSIANMVQGLIQIAFTLLLGVASDLISLRTAGLTTTGLMMVIAVAMCVFIFMPMKARYYRVNKQAA